MKNKNYNELSNINSYDDRFKYLSLKGNVGSDTFGFDRHLNQDFYKSKEWKQIRNQVIIRDNGCDLGVKGKKIYGKIYVHHMNPIEKKDIVDSTEYLLNPDFLICTSKETHDAIHYGNEEYLKRNEVHVRKKNDTCPWKK